MIVLRNLTKVFHRRGVRKVVVNNLNTVFPTNRSIGLLGRNGAGKSTLLKMIAGTSGATSGEVLTDGTISFPIGFAGSFHPDMTGAQNTRFVARIYGIDADLLADYVRNFAELGSHFHQPIRTYSSGMRSRLSFGVSMGLSFDTYLIDEITAVGDASFKKKSRTVFLDRMEKSGALFVSHSTGMLRDMCESGAVLEDGNLSFFDNIDDAIDLHLHNMNKRSDA